MFTGIVQAVGRITARQLIGRDLRLQVATAALDPEAIGLGDSIATNGVCLTVTGRTADGFRADVSGESLARTTLGALRVGDPVNLEPALRPIDRLGGHLVSGHVDGVGRVVALEPSGISVRLRIAAPVGLARYIAEKGSICVDGISLTVNAVDGAEFELNIVPHTFAQTTLAGIRVGSQVNLEVDLVARYLERLLLGERAAAEAPAGLTLETLAAQGFAAGR